MKTPAPRGPELELEGRHLDETRARMEREMADIHRRFDEQTDAADDRSTESVLALYEQRFRQLGKIFEEGTPYFGRIDLLIREEEALRRIYLGKFALHDEDGEPLVTDWRAPVANLYYENAVGPAWYKVENRTIECDLMLKRKLDIKKFKLKSYDDTDIISADEALLPYLAAASDVRLKNIIATIQAEQNAIIRQDIHRHLIVQGMAGSGKTTVALHRVAYLVYLHRKDFHPEHFLILSSGGFFLNYISGILPDLGVENVPQDTFEGMCAEHLGEEIAAQDPLTWLYEGDTPRRAAFEAEARYKSDVGILKDIDAFISARYTRQQLGELRDSRSKIRVSGLYREFLRERGLSDGLWQQEDLAPMLYLSHKLYATANRYIRHIIIDEAQDFSAVQLRVLRLIYQTASFTILGDLAQGIYPWRGVRDWGSVNLAAFDGAAKQMYLQKGYRTTVEIVEAANGVLTRLAALPEGEALPPGQAVLRHGPAVERRVVRDSDERVDACRDFLALCEAEGHRNAALIVRGPKACRTLAEALGVAALAGRDDQYIGGACVITAALSKGLEFDAVAVADGERYRENAGDLHLLYVAMTRPMHVLWMIERA